jgi:Membrane protein involved in the export of O-antigen and teichoic acid
MPESPLEKQPTEADSQQSPSLRKKAIRGSMWTLAGYGSSIILRLGSNLLLTRLLFPKAFGLMALVYTFMSGLAMFSDIGIGPSIVQNKRGNDPAFLNTAWTIQAIRGLVLGIGACLLAWPAAQFYREPMLVELLPAVGLTSVIDGLNSTRLATANRQLALGKLTLMELGCSALSIAVMIVSAWIYKSVWALVAGGIAGSLAKMILSHIVLEGEKNRFHWDSEAFKEINRFGRWIFFSTALTFFDVQSDRLLLGRLLDVQVLGIYSIAITLASTGGDAITGLGHRVLFPSYAELIRDRPERLYPTLRKTRLILIALSWSVSLFFIFFGKVLIDFLYDDRYIDAGWMLQIISIGVLVNILAPTYDNVLLAKGKTFALAVFLALQVTLAAVAMVLGFYWGGARGLIIGAALTYWIVYIPRAIYLSRLSLWQPEVDLPFLAIASLIAAIFFSTSS